MVTQLHNSELFGHPPSLKQADLDPGPRRRKRSWDEFFKIHARTLWACDFLSKRVWTLHGMTDCFVLIFIHVQSRRVIATPATASPDSSWVAQHARNFIQDAEEAGQGVGHLIHDRDAKCTAQFDVILGAEGVTIHRLGPVKPNLNAFAERFVQSIQLECLDAFIVLGEKHLNHLVREYVEHYNDERPHMALGRPPNGLPPPGEGAVVCDERLGGLLKSYRRAA